MEKEDLLLILTLCAISAGLFYGGWFVRDRTLRPVLLKLAEEESIRQYMQGRQDCTFQDVLRNLQAKEDVGENTSTNP